MSHQPSDEPSSAELDALRTQVIELQDALASLGGGVDAIVFDTPEGNRLYTTTNADRAARATVEHMGEGAATISEGGVILYANPTLADFLGVTRDEMLGRDLVDFVGVADLPALTRLMTTDATGGRREEVSIPKADGTMVPFLVVSTDIVDEGVTMRCLVFTDLTMQKIVEQQVASDAARTERQQVAHEVNDTIVQGLVAAEMALDLGQVDFARTLVSRTSEHARHWIGELAGSEQLKPGMAKRLGPARPVGPEEA